MARRIILALLVVLVGGLLVGTGTAQAQPAPRPRAPTYVVSGDGTELFLGADFDNACFRADLLAPALRRLGAVAATVRKSGRRVVFTVVPDKTLVDGEALAGAVIPHGRCSLDGLAEQRRVLRTFADPAYLPVSEALARSRRQVYWRGDSHWTSIGASIWATRLAGRLDPRVRRRLHFVPGTESRFGDLDTARAADAPAEVAPAALPDPRTTVTGAPEGIGLDYRWTSAPRSRGYHGRTVVVGDSFTYLGMPVLRPVLSRGHFLWGPAVPRRTVLDGIVDSDTVVIEVVQRNVASSDLVKPSFLAALGRALKVDPAPVRRARRMPAARAEPGRADPRRGPDDRAAAAAGR